MRTYIIYEQARPYMRHGEWVARFLEVGTVRAEDSWQAIQAGKRLTSHPITVPHEEDYRRLRISPMDLAQLTGDRRRQDKRTDEQGS